jgi:hypothetical protein
MTVDKNTFRSFLHESRIYFNQFLSWLVLNTPSWHIFIQVSVDGLTFSPLNYVLYHVSFVLYSCDGMNVCGTGLLTSPLYIPHVIYECIWERRCNDSDGKTEELGRKTCSSATWSTTDPTCTTLGANLGPRRETLHCIHSIATGPSARAV